MVYMGTFKKKLAVLLGVMAVVGILPLQVFAASKVSKISLTIESDMKSGANFSAGDVEVTTKGDNYYVDEIELLNEEGVWNNGDIPEIKITLSAEDGYSFSVNKDNIRIKNGVYVSSEKEDSYTMAVTVKLTSFLETIGELTGVGWSSKNEASWNGVQNAGHYEVRLYRDDKSVGTVQTVTEPKIDFGSLMGKEGTYKFKVRAINMRKQSVKSEWVEAGGTSYIDSAAAEEIRNKYGTSIPESATEPSQVTTQSYNPDQYGWILDNGGWWYRNADKSYTTNNWQFINEKWYYFNSVGYMVTGWIEWNGKSYYCDPVNGDMLVNTIVPDGSGRKVDSTGAWIE